jgi:hypothetical protein
MYFDDIIGSDVWLCNEFTGEQLSIEEFNQRHKSKKIARNYYVSNNYPPNSWWPEEIFIFHDFWHPRYNDFIGDNEQQGHEDSIKLDRNPRSALHQLNWPWPNAAMTAKRSRA